MVTATLHDTPSVLPDRGQLLSTLATSLNDAKGAGELVAVITLKVHRLKDVSIEFGYAESDSAIQQFIDRLRGCLREKDHLARINSDEFALVLPGLRNHAQPLMAINKIQRTCGEAMDFDGREVKFKPTFGTSIGPDDAGDAEDLLRCADVALRDAESTNVDSVRFSEREASDSDHVLQLETELESALGTGALQAYYQPIVDVETGELAGVEMLTRWPEGPFGGEISPEIFINTAEQCGLIMPLTLWGLNNGLRECSDWQTVLPNLPVSINFSNLVLNDPHLPEIVQGALKLWGAECRYLTVEITESALMTNPEECLRTLNELHSHGIKIAIDDFGTGYSSLAYLKELPVDILKIDKSFVTNMIESTADRRIVQTVIDLAHNFDLMVVAEGVEDEETLDTLMLMGCQRAQGFHVGQPMRSSDLESWFEASPWEPTSSEGADS